VAGLGAKDRDVIAIGRAQQQFFDRAHRGGAIADHDKSLAHAASREPPTHDRNAAFATNPSLMPLPFERLMSGPVASHVPRRT
jgi:hypothetical protein